MSHLVYAGDKLDQPINPNTQSLVDKFKARESIRQHIGKFIEVKSGAFLYKDTLRFPVVEYWVKVPHHFLMPQDDITQEQYDLIASLINSQLQPGEELMPFAAEAMNPDESTPNFVGPRKPMGGLMLAQWQRYLTKLNEVLTPLWVQAYPDQIAPRFKVPKENELRLAMSDPLEKPAGGYKKHDGVPINSVFSTFSGANVPLAGLLKPDQYTELNSHVVFGKSWENGPLEVDDPSILPNKRGFRNLSGNIKKLTITPYDGDPDSHLLTTLSNDWSSTYSGISRSNRSYFDTRETSVAPYIGLRLVGIAQ